MTDVKYTRVNVSSNTSVPRFNEFNERYGEIDLQLPSNLISNIEKVKSVEMAVMKMAVPLSELPVVSLPLTQWTNNNLLSTRGIVSIFPFEYDRDGQLVAPPSGIFRLFSLFLSVRGLVVFLLWGFWQGDRCFFVLFF